jgi:tRNA A-37 threonylcarbamoyl transferase component Bud32
MRKCEACGDDPALRRQVDALLRRHEDAGSFLEHPPLGDAGSGSVAPDSANGPAQPLAIQTEAAGTIAGRYKLLEEIGEGGMGTVWVAEQTEPVRRRVALKLIKPGLDSVQVIRRFEAERQALALMDHSNIAKVFDAGATAAGRPYFVMDLVKGVPITLYCDELQLPLRERLELFVPVCQAIQHAHQKGIIHRDIKPSNVLICMQDGKAVPKIIDFGVAKALRERLTNESIYTEIGQLIGTLEYMSPEQAELCALDIDARADVYALGVLLYELLTGTTPLEKTRLRKAAFAELLRTIKEVEPPRPSTRLTESKESLPSLAAQRRTDSAKLPRDVRGDLDWIVMRCLEKDRTRRYETASGLARDIERHLRDEAVEARPPRAGYRLRKFLRRRRARVALASAVLLILIAFLTVAFLVMLVNRERMRAAVARMEEVTAMQRAKEQRLYAESLEHAAGALNRKSRDDRSPSPRIEKFPDGTIVKIEFEGTSNPVEKIKPKLLSRVGQALSHEKAEADLKTLLGTKWFSDATYWVDETPPKSGKYTLNFSLKDVTLLTKVEFLGRKAIRLKEIEDITGLKAGNRADPSQTWRAVGQIQELYREKGYDLASVTLLEGGNKGDTKIVIEIFEGPRGAEGQRPRPAATGKAPKSPP